MIHLDQRKGNTNSGHLSAPEQPANAAALRQSRRWMHAVSLSLVSTTVFAVGWLALARTDEVVIAPGSLEPIGAVREIQMPLGGVAADILVKEGQAVKAGQVLIQLDQKTSRQKVNSLQEAINLKQRELNLKQKELQRYLELNAAEADMLSNNLRLDTEIMNRFEQLAREGASAELQFLQQQNKVKETHGRLMQNRIERLRQQAVLDQQTQQLRAALEQLRSDLVEASTTLRYQEIRSPVDGVVFNLKPKSIGFAAQGTEPILTVVPQKDLEVRAEISSRDIGFVKVGMPVEISVDSYPASDFGSLKGEVRQIGSDALPPDPNKSGEAASSYRYPAKISLASQGLKARDGKDLPLQVGMSVEANIKLRKVSYLELLLGTFRDKANSIRRI
ncbi:HlyD family efflux transporter periplasmic adaptor subunit [Synechococcus sp. CCY9201]|uniref:HlyD family secretion protein n=1 Tax=Synechococcus sp. CCY9201 TaxID=174697 RepID=UPI002B211CB6|nr:HlyD family efflux transporter periplasmic adaptor subunit [Synechococcus sp. CCY9201]MEA5472760.1 HlyD family efflux transporter periplasmic adaptor subunit [Synechococcus sp. CCY9201]